MKGYLTLHYTSGSSTIESFTNILDAYHLIHSLIAGSILGLPAPLKKIELEIASPNTQSIKHVVWDISWLNGS